MKLVTCVKLPKARRIYSAWVLGSALVMAATGVAAGAEHVVASQTSSFDCSVVKAGDTVTLTSGIRGPLTIRNCKGAPSSRITIRNDPQGAGPTIISRSTGGAGGFIFHCRDCSGVVIDGSTKWRGAPSEATYGIKITMSGGESPSAFLQLSGISSFVTIRNVEIDGAWPLLATDGIGIQLNDHSLKAADHPGIWREGVLIEKSYVHDTEGEGLYIGPNWNDGDIPLRNIEIRGCLIEDTGWEAIQLKSAIAGTNEIHHNVVRRAGKRSDDKSQAQTHGISMFVSTGRIYSNFVQETGDSGIQFWTQTVPDSYGAQAVEIFNNIVTETGLIPTLNGYGIRVGSEPGSAPLLASVYSNTLVSTRGSGIRIGGEIAEGTVRDNVIANAQDEPIRVPAMVKLANNRTGTIEQMIFVDPGVRDFRLRSTSPARDAGSKVHPADDYAGISRPQGGIADQGALEFAVEGDATRPESPIIIGIY